MRKPQPIKDFQRKRLFGLAKDKAALAGHDTHEYLGDVAAEVTNGRTSSLKELTFAEANAMITSLGGVPFTLFLSKRTENYRKQVAGIKTIETDAHLKLIDEYAERLGWDAGRLRGFCQRQIKKDVPATTEEGNKVLEGLKAMTRRKNVVPFPKAKAQSPQPAASSQPSFRRVA